MGAAVVALPFCAYNLSVYGHPLPSYFQGGRLSAQGATVAEAFAGNWVSPARGLLVFSPVLVFSLGWAVAALRRRSLSPVDAVCLFLIVAHAVVISTFPHWWGGHSVGPRLFTDVLPCFAWLLAPALPQGSGRSWRAAVLALFAAWSVWVHGRAAWTYALHRWNDGPPNVDLAPERLWDWKDPQFLRGLGP